MSSDNKTYSVVLRVQRVTYEDAYVAVPVTSAIMAPEPQADGTSRLDWNALVAEAIILSAHEGVEWRVEESAITPHPTQQPKPDERGILDGFHLQSRHEPGP